jgi:NAD(P)-dependent dehydrogenase (short-subunit alcohol dehydrogenase family)
MASEKQGAAIVTGAAQGIGRAVVLNDLEIHKQKLVHVEAEVKELKGRAIALPGDISIEENVHNLVQSAVATFDRLDVVGLLNLLR